MSETLPLSIVNNRRMSKWIAFQPDRTVRLAVGKVEIGQGVLIALTQIAAEELDIALDRFTIVSGDTRDAPDEGSTSSSQSIEMSGRSVRLVTAELRARVIERLARRLNCSPSDIAVDDGAFLLDDEPTGHDYWNFSNDTDFAEDIAGTARPKDPAAYKIVGQPVPRKDLAAKVSGAAFIHDIVRPGMSHARVLRQPSRGATLTALDEAAIRRAARGDFRVVRTGNFVAFVSEDETVVQRAAAVGDAMVSARADAGIQTAGAQLSHQSWGSILPFAVGVVNATDPYAAGITINFQGMLAQSGDTLTLGGYSVVRLP